jgi:catechol 2,3-dioxygenase-like lactoylglutathione lyase family enzyme
VPLINNFQAVTISVSNIERSLSFYRDLLGFPVLGQASYDNQTTAHFLDIGNQHVLRLLSFSSETKPSLWIPDDLQTGLRHAAFKVRDVDSTTARLKQANVEFTLDPLDATGDVRIAFFKDPDGALLEIVQNDLHYHTEGPAFTTQMPAPPQDNSLRFDHVAVSVSDLDQALTFYTARLGFSMIGQLFFKDARDFVITYLRVGDAVLELFSYSAPMQANPWIPELAVLGIKYPSFSVSNLDGLVKNLEAAGIKVLPKTAANQGKAVLIEGPDNLALEFTEGAIS